MRLRAFLGLAVLAVSGGLALGQPALAPELAEPETNPVLTDRRPYCDSLARQVATWQQIVQVPHAEADHLAMEGARMCAIGHVRQGVRRLRFALMELMELRSDER